MLTNTLVALAFYTASTFAHGGVIGYLIGGIYYKGFAAYNTPVGQVTIQREWDTYNPITSVSDPTFACNNNGSSLASGKLSATVEAGSSITAFWNTWPHVVGPVMVYMASCGSRSNCTGVNSNELDWFKIDQAGLLSGTVGSGYWAQGKLVANNDSWTSTIPFSLAPGAYLIRHELLALHASYQPQFYPECAQLILTGDGNKSGTPTVKFPGAYNASDPSININIYNISTSAETTYTIPGPTVFAG